MEIETIIVGDLSTNCYVLNIENHVLVIDPGDEYDKISKCIGNRIIDGVLITHGHFDHVGAKEMFDSNLIHDYNNLDEGIVKLGKFTFEVIYNPGHKEDSISFYFDSDKALFCGDFIFYESIGRTDLDGGNILDMFVSLKNTSRYDDDVTIYPGHGRSSNFSHERKYNIYLKKAYNVGDDYDEF